ncbi:MAG: hypothetical protein ACKERG_03945 [Candidatus Hodgkinia cicadicola]
MALSAANAVTEADYATATECVLLQVWTLKSPFAPFAPLVRPFVVKEQTCGRLAAADEWCWVHISIGSRDVSFESFWEFNLSATAVQS